MGFPAPFQGPGVPEATESQRELVREGWAHLVAGESDRALASAREAGDHPTATLLAYQVALADAGPGLVEPLEGLASRLPEWAAAQLTLSVAAEAAENNVAALRAASAGADLWPSRRWRERADRLRSEVIEQPLETARDLLERKRYGEAAAAARGVLAVEPDFPAALKLLGLALMGDGDTDEAEEVLAALRFDPEALEAAGELAGRRGAWAVAMDRYRALPHSWPGRAQALDRAAIYWRFQNMPPYVLRASQTERLTRAELAVLLTAVAPDLATFATGSAPLMPDIVGRPDQREILTVVRADLIRPDAVSHQFDPDAPVDAEMIRRTLDHLARLLDEGPVPWCDGDDRAQSDCLTLTEPSGPAVTDLLLELLGGGGAS